MIPRLVKKYLYGMMVYSAKQNPGIWTTPGQLRQSIQMKQSGFNAKTNLMMNNQRVKPFEENLYNEQNIVIKTISYQFTTLFKS